MPYKMMMSMATMVMMMLAMEERARMWTDARENNRARDHWRARAHAHARARARVNICAREHARLWRRDAGDDDDDDIQRRARVDIRLLETARA